MGSAAAQAESLSAQKDKLVIRFLFGAMTPAYLRRRIPHKTGRVRMPAVPIKVLSPIKKYGTNENPGERHNLESV